jgi:hypothetical protein
MQVVKAEIGGTYAAPMAKMRNAYKILSKILE